jgi:hypothetical protein
MLVRRRCSSVVLFDEGACGWLPGRIALTRLRKHWDTSELTVAVYLFTTSRRRDS